MRVITLLYVLLLLYVVSALVFWGISLNRQSNLILQNEIALLRKDIDSTANPEKYREAYLALANNDNMRQHQYLGEGATFLAIILIGAGVVYSSIRSNHKLALQQKNFMLSITHELKSPLAAIKLNLQTLGRRALDDDKKTLLLDRSIAETDRLNDLCSNLLITSQMESKEFKSSEEKLNFTWLVEGCVQENRQRNSRHRYIEQLEQDCFTVGDKLLLQLMVNNLLENAAKYAPASTDITISLKNHDDHLLLAIADEGIGIPNDEKQKIFHKFYRVGSEETRKTKGTGLGLYLTEKIINRHKGSVVVRDNEPKGAVFEVSLNTA